MSNLLSRRDVLTKGSWMAVGLMTPSWLSAVTRSDLVRAAKGKPPTGGVLVVCQLSGGNDGLNTLVPYADPLYRQLRPTLALPESDLLDLDGHMALHPSLGGLRDLYAEGKVALVQGVGYENPNLSHFKSMDIWHQASPDGSLKYGWIGRHFDLMASRNAFGPVDGLGLSVDKPRALAAKQAGVPCFASLNDVQSMLGDPDTERLLRQMQGPAQAGSVGAAQKAGTAALDAVAALHDKLGSYTPTGDYGDTDFGKAFRQAAQLVATSPQTRVIYLSAGGFDTHAQQPERHAQLLEGFGNAVKAFQREMEALGKADQVMVMAFSEFGRRAYENASLGTDHGKAGPMVLVGTRVRGGLHGPRPDLTNLDAGDLKHEIDFRSVYAVALDDWLGSDSATVLGGEYRRLELVK